MKSKLESEKGQLLNKSIKLTSNKLTKEEEAEFLEMVEGSLESLKKESLES